MAKKSGLTRRQFLHMAVVSAAGTFLAACAQPAPVQAPEPTSAQAEAASQATEAPQPTTAPTVAPKTAVTISYWTPGEELGGQQPVIDKFEKDTGNKIDHTYVPLTAGTQASEKLMASIAGGEPPDVAYFDRFLVASWAARDALTNITPLAERDGVKQEDFLPHTWKEAVYCSKLYALPTTTDARALFYNRAHFKDAGLDPAKGPQSWNDLDALQDTLTQGNAKDGYKRIGTIPWYPWLEWMLYIWAMTNEGVDVWDFDKKKSTMNTEPWLEAANWMIKYAKNYQVGAIDAFGSQFGDNAQDPFGNGLISIMQHGNWMLGSYDQYFPDLDYDVVAMPGPTSATGRNLAGGWSVIVPKGAKHLEEGWSWAKYYTSEEAQYMLFRDNPKELLTSEVPTRMKVAKDPKAYYAIHPKAKAFVDTLEKQYIRPPIPEAQLLFEELGKASDLIVHLKADPKEALDGVAAKVDDAMAKWSC